MRRTLSSRRARIAAIALSTLAGGGLLPVVAHAAVNTVRVDNTTTACKDDSATSGSMATPFCTVPAALASDTVTSGTTLLLTGVFPGGVDIAKSGITLQSANLRTAFVGGAYGISITGQHDITVNGVRFGRQTGEAVRISGSSNIVINQGSFATSQFGTATPDPTVPAVRLDNVTNVTVARSAFVNDGGPGLGIEGGSSGVVISGDTFDSSGGGVQVTDSRTVDVVSDTIDENCGAGVGVSGTSSDVDIANDIISNARTCDSVPGVGVSVTASGTPATLDSNIVTANADSVAVQWQGQSFADAAALDSAGHGHYDLTADPGFATAVSSGGYARANYNLTPSSPAIDSADSGARNEPSGHIDDPAVADTGHGSYTYADRGAVEFVRSATPTLNVYAVPGQTPDSYRYAHIWLNSQDDSWSPIVSYTIDYGDGHSSGTLPYPPPNTPAYTYGTDGTFTGSITAVDGLGHTFKLPFTITIAKQVFAPTLDLAVSQNPSDPPGTVYAEISTPPNSTPIGSYTLSFGDGSPTVTWKMGDPGLGMVEQIHTYAKSGTYPVTFMGADSSGWPMAAPLTQKITVTLPSSPPPPPPVIQPSVKRIGGSDRYQTSLLVSQAQWKDGSANAVVLARGDQAPDALAGVPLAAHVHGPLLLTDPSTLDGATSAEIARVTGGPAPDKTVYILGGNAAVSPSIESGLRAAGYHVVRYKGDDRYGTARAVASAFGSTSHVIVATGQDFPDALAAGPLGAVENAPIVLSSGDTLDPATAAFVLAHPAIDAVGGAASTAVHNLNTAGKTVTPLAGQTRYETAAAVAGAVARVTGHAPTGVGIASGESFPDALTGGAYAANAGIPLLITESDALAAPTLQQLSGWANALTAVTVFGGEKAVGSGVLSEIVSAVKGKVQ
jgi:putative cell wall-binding protein